MTYWKRLLILTLALCLCALPLNLALAQSSARVGVFKEYQAAPDMRVEVPIEIKGVTDLYAIDLELTFDPTILSAEDADPNTAGIQPGLGIFLDAGMTLFNEVRLQAGKVHFVMSQINPSEPKSGDGVIIVVYFKGIAEGESALTISSLTLSDRGGVEIPATAVDSKINIAVGTVAPVTTSVPVQNPVDVIIVPTLAPTNTPQATAMPTATVMPTPVPTAVVAAVKPGAEPTSVVSLPVVVSEGALEQENEDFSLASSWWILLLVGLVLAGFALYLLLSRKHGQPPQEGLEANPQKFDNVLSTPNEHEKDDTIPPLG